jgi:hypothetical protein
MDDMLFSEYFKPVFDDCSRDFKYINCLVRLLDVMSPSGV